MKGREKSDAGSEEERRKAEVKRAALGVADDATMGSVSSPRCLMSESTGSVPRPGLRRSCRDGALEAVAKHLNFGIDTFSLLVA